MSRKSQARRVSILKPPRPETNDDENEAKVQRKVRFSSNFVKEFMPVRDDNYLEFTIWANDTYEEAIERSSSSNASSQLQDKENVLPHKVQKHTAQEKAKNDFFPDFMKPPEGINPVKFALPDLVSKSSGMTSKKWSENDTQEHLQSESVFHDTVEQDIQKSVLLGKATIANTLTRETDGVKRISYFNSTTMGNDSYVFDMTKEFISPLFSPDKINTDTGKRPGGEQKTIFFNATLEETKLGAVEIKDNLQKEHLVKNIDLKLRPTLHFCHGVDDDALYNAGTKARLPVAVIQEDTGMVCEFIKNVGMCNDEENLKSTLTLRPTIHFNDHCDDADMDITRVVEKTGIFDIQIDKTNKSVIKPRQTILFDVSSKDGDMDVTQGVGNFCQTKENVSRGLVELKTKGKSMKAYSDNNAGVDVTSAVEKTNMIVYEDKTKKFIAKPCQTIIFNVNSEDRVMNVTQGAGNFFQSRADVSKGAVDSQTEGKLSKSIHCHVYSDDVDIGMTSAKEKTNIFTVQEDRTEKSNYLRRTILFNNSSEDGAMDMTRGVSNVIHGTENISKEAELITEGKSRKTILFNAYSADEDMDITRAVERTNVIETKLFNVSSEGAGNLFQGRAEGCKGAVEFKTVEKLRNSDDADMDMTKVLETIIVDVHDDRTNKSIEAAQQMTIFNVNSKDITQGAMNLIHCLENDSKEVVDLITDGKLKKIIHFNVHSDDADMDITKAIDRTNIFNAQEERTNTSVAKSEQTILCNVNSEDMYMVQGARRHIQGKENIFKETQGGTVEKLRKTIHLKSQLDDADMDMTQGAENFMQENENIHHTPAEEKYTAKTRQTILFNYHLDDADMDMTRTTSNLIKDAEITPKNTNLHQSIYENGYGTKLFEIAMEETALMEVGNQEALETIAKSRRTIHFNVISNDADMDMTQGAANFIQDKDNIFENSIKDKSNIKTKEKFTCFVQSDDADMDINKTAGNHLKEAENITKDTNFHGNINENYDGTEFKMQMEELVFIDPCSIKSHATRLESHETLETIATSRQTMNCNAIVKDTDMDITRGAGNFIQDKGDISGKPAEDNAKAIMIQAITYNAQSDDVEMHMAKTEGIEDELTSNVFESLTGEENEHNMDLTITKLSMDFSPAHLFEQIDPIWDDIAEEEPTFQVDDVSHDSIESVVILDATLNEPLVKGTENSTFIGDLRKKYLKQVIKEIHLSEIDYSKFRRQPLELSLGSWDDLDERLKGVEEKQQKIAQVQGLVDARRKQLHEEINDQMKKVKLDIEKLEEPIDIQKTLAVGMTLTDQIRQKARNHEQYKILDVSKECLRVFVDVGEFELSVTMKKDCETVVSLVVDEPILDEKTNDSIRWVRKFFHHLMNPQRIKSCIGPEFSVLSLLDYLEFEMAKFGEIFIAVYHSMITYPVEFKDDQLFYRHFTFWLDVEIIVNLSDFNMEKATVTTIIHDGQASLRMIEEIIAAQARDTKFPLNVLTTLDKYFDSVSQRKDAKP